MAIKLKGSNANIDLTTNIGQLVKGDDGGYYIPAVDADGVLTWTPSEEGMEPVISANIRGPQGIQGIQGEKGIQGIQGIQGPKGDKGDTGATGPKGDKGDQGIQGEPGKDGTMTFEELTDEQKASLKGEPGEKGEDGEPGAPGVWVGNTEPTDEFTVWIAPAGEETTTLVTYDEMVEYVDTHATGGGTSADLTNYYTKTEVDNIVETIELTPGPQGEPGAAFTYDMFTQEQLNALQGPAGAPGEDGKTPVKGVDYYTEADKTEMVNLVLAAIPSAEEVNY